MLNKRSQDDGHQTKERDKLQIQPATGKAHLLQHFRQLRENSSSSLDGDEEKKSCCLAGIPFISCPIYISTLQLPPLRPWHLINCEATLAGSIPSCWKRADPALQGVASTHAPGVTGELLNNNSQERMRAGGSGSARGWLDG